MKRFKRRGLNFFCEALVEMKETPAFASKLKSKPPAVDEFVAIDASELSRTLRSLNRRGDYEGLSQVALDYLGELKKQPQLNCMVRHGLESILRSAKLAPKYLHRAAASNLRVRKLRRLISSFLRLHM